jgi:hypothetical protein
MLGGLFMDLGAAAEGVSNAGLAGLTIATWPFWLLSLAVAILGAVHRSRLAAMSAVGIVIGIHVVLLFLGAWQPLANPFASLGAGGFRTWAAVYQGLSLIVVACAVLAFRPKPSLTTALKLTRPIARE